MPSKKKLFRHQEGSQVDRAQSAGRRRWSIATSAKSFPQGDENDDKDIIVSKKCQNIIFIILENLAQKNSKSVLKVT